MVQFARGCHDQADYAIKFFLDEQAFRAEEALYAACSPQMVHRATHTSTADASAEGQTAGTGTTARKGAMPNAAARFLPRLQTICDGSTCKLVDPHGRRLPPCIVMERGESLQDWSQRAEPDLFTSLAVCTKSSVHGNLVKLAQLDSRF